MAKRTVEKATGPNPGLSAEERERLDRELYRQLLLVRFFDERVSTLHKQNKVVGGLYPGYGHEATTERHTTGIDERHDHVLVPRALRQHRLWAGRQLLRAGAPVAFGCRPSGPGGP